MTRPHILLVVFNSLSEQARTAPGTSLPTRTQYWAMIALVDFEGGRILATLKASGQAGDTLVVFSSEHGEMLGNHQQLLKGPQL